MALLKYGRQMVMGVSRSQQQVLGFGRLLTTKSTHLCSCDFKKIGDDDYIKNFDSRRNIIGLAYSQYPQANSSGGFFSNLFRKVPPPPPGRLAVLFGKIMDLTEIIKSCPEENAHVDKISPLWKEMLGVVSDYSIVELLYELARPAASRLSPPPDVRDIKVKQFVDNIPAKIMPVFQDLMVERVEAKYKSVLDMNIRCKSLLPKNVYVTADVFNLEKASIRVFVVGDVAMVIATNKIDKDDLYATRPTPTPKQMVKLPQFPYLHHNVAGSILEGKLKIDFPVLVNSTSTVVNNPKIFQVKLY